MEKEPHKPQDSIEIFLSLPGNEHYRKGYEEGRISKEDLAEFLDYNPQKDLGGGIGEIVTKSVVSSEKSPDTPRYPQTEDGLIDIDNLKPGDYLPEWNEVRGRLPGEDDAEISVTDAPRKMQPAVRTFKAAKEYAKRYNENTLAIQSGDEERIKKTRENLNSWLRHATDELRARTEK